MFSCDTITSRYAACGKVQALSLINSGNIFACGNLPLRRFKSRLSPGSGEHDSVEHQRHFAWFDLVSRDRRKLKPSLLQSLVPDRETVSIPVHDLDSRCAFVSEDEEMAGKGILPQNVFDEHHKTIERSPHVRRIAAEKEPNRRRQSQHDRSRVSSRSVRVGMRAPARSEIPEGNLSSSSSPRTFAEAVAIVASSMKGVLIGTFVEPRATAPT